MFTENINSLNSLISSTVKWLVYVLLYTLINIIVVDSRFTFRCDISFYLSIFIVIFRYFVVRGFIKHYCHLPVSLWSFSFQMPLWHFSTHDIMISEFGRVFFFCRAILISPSRLLIKPVCSYLKLSLVLHFSSSYVSQMSGNWLSSFEFYFAR